ncbi:MAG: DUF4148 domain-containing protein [Ottowia sp.]|uniref:DUF4148 domain-containing protein n=1 Tax=Ottowia sp. TaxID=1898956 RepID=UPI003C742282
MNKSRFIAISAWAIIAGLLTLPSLAQANSAWHQGNGDIVRFTPEHVASTKTRAQVNAELNTVIANGTLRYYQWNVPVPGKASAQPPLTRQQVIKDMLNQSPEQQRALSALYNG